MRSSAETHSANTSIRRNVGAFAAIFCILIVGTWTAVKFTADHLLYQYATAAAQNWARYLAGSVTDLEQIAAGEQPSAASMDFFRMARQSGQVFRYEIFNRHGFSQFVSDRDTVAPVDISEFSADAAGSVSSGRPAVDAEEGHSLDQPSYFARAYVPIIVDGKAVAVVASYVDQTQQRDELYKTFSIAATALCLLTALSFVIPTIAWYRRTKKGQIADRRIRFLAHHDALTGLANRAQLTERLNDALAAFSPDGGGLAVHFLDLDRFKEVNDTLGHDAGDFLLKTVAERLRSVVRQDDVIARLGGDEFVVVQTGITGKNAAEVFAHRLAAALALPVQFRDHQIVATASIGVATAPADGRSSERLLKSADLALYKSKADGRNCVRCFSPDMDTELQTRIEIEKAIRQAVLCDGFELHYQPLFEISDRRLIGYEALVRLPRKDGTLIPPLDFIPVAEEIRLIDKVGAWVLREACKTAATWPDHLTVAVNLSPAQFAVGSISEVAAAALREAGLAPGRLELEITETLLLGDDAVIMNELRALKALGVMIVMDDFGTGYSSLSYLWRFPFDKLKIDRSLMQGVDESGRDAKTVMKTIIALGRELKMRVTVEGVETAKQVEFLDEALGDQAQGYFFGRPAPAAQIATDILADLQIAKAGKTTPRCPQNGLSLAG